MLFTETLSDFIANNLNYGVERAIDIFKDTYKEVTDHAFQLKNVPINWIDIDKIISGEKEIGEPDNEGNDVIIIDTSYDDVRTLMYVSSNGEQKTLHLHSACEEPNEDDNLLVKPKTEFNRNAVKSSFALSSFDAFELKQQIITALTSKYAMDCQPR